MLIQLQQRLRKWLGDRGKKDACAVRVGQLCLTAEWRLGSSLNNEHCLGIESEQVAEARVGFRTVCRLCESFLGCVAGFWGIERVL